jgi:hypothetical protein
MLRRTAGNFIRLRAERYGETSTKLEERSRGGDWLAESSRLIADKDGGQSVTTESNHREAEEQRVGLCVTCQHAAVIVSSRGSRFYRCERSRTDARFPRYPTLPVVTCIGWEQSSGSQPGVDDTERKG